MAAQGAGEAETSEKDTIATKMPTTGPTKMKFGVLIGLIEVGEIENRDIVDTVLDLVSIIIVRVRCNDDSEGRLDKNTVICQKLTKIRK